MFSVTQFLKTPTFLPPTSHEIGLVTFSRFDSVLKSVLGPRVLSPRGAFASFAVLTFDRLLWDYRSGAPDCS